MANVLTVMMVSSQLHDVCFHMHCTDTKYVAMTLRFGRGIAN